MSAEQQTITFTYLHAMYREARPSEQSLVTDIALEVFGLLMLNKYLLIIKLSVAIPAQLSQGTSA